MNKTNAMRLLDAAGIRYDPKEYEVDESDLSGMHLCTQIGLEPQMVYKTLVLTGDKLKYFVVCIPVCDEIDLKKAASITGNKKVEMVHVKDLLKITGYIRGGCSPVGMKKKFPTFFSQKVKDMDLITVSAGIRGIQLLLNAAQLVDYVEAQCCDITKD